MLSHYLPIKDFLGATSDGKESACNVGDLGLIPVLGRTPGEGNSRPLQYSGLKNSMDRGAQRAAAHGLTKFGHNLVTKPPPPLQGTQVPSLVREPRSCVL